MTEPAGSTITIHNNRPAVIGLYAFAIICVFLSGCMALMAIYEAFMQHGHAFMRWLGAVQWGGGAFGFLYLGWAVWGRAGLTWFARAQLDEAGLHLRLGTRKKPKESFFAWGQIGEIDKQLVGSNWMIMVNGKNGDYAWYTPYDIFRYMKLANLIAARSGVGITLLPPYKAPAKVAAVKG
jgi:hypothetical protein